MVIEKGEEEVEEETGKEGEGQPLEHSRKVEVAQWMSSPSPPQQQQVTVQRKYYRQSLSIFGQM